MRPAGRDILCFSSIDWDFLWQLPQQTMAGLAASGNRVLFIENTGVRSPTWSDASRIRKRLRNFLRGRHGFRRERENLFIYSPLILPFAYSPMARRINRFLLVRTLRRWMRAEGFARPIVWTFLPTPLVAETIEELDPALAVYHCADDFASSSPAARRIRESEERLFETADLVFVTSQRLRERAERFRERAHLFPSGVSASRFQSRPGGNGLPADLSALPRPRIGYIGGVHRWVDQGLLEEVCRRLPEMSFVLVGPFQVGVSRLTRLPNLFLIGERPPEELPRYAEGFDVGIIPYRLTEYTESVMPSKLWEYLAAGIPAVSTDLPEIRRFNAENRGIVRLARDPESFSESIRRAVAGLSLEERNRSIEIARENSLEGRLAGMTALVEKALAGRTG